MAALVAAATPGSTASSTSRTGELVIGSKSWTVASRRRRPDQLTGGQAGERRRRRRRTSTSPWLPARPAVATLTSARSCGRPPSAPAPRPAVPSVRRRARGRRCARAERLPVRALCLDAEGIEELRVDPPARGRPPRGRHVRHPRRRHRGDRPRRSDRAGRAERRRQDDAPPDRRRASTSRTAAIVHAQARADDRPARPGGALRRGVHGRAGPPGRGPPRRGPPRGDGRGARRIEHDGRVGGAGYADLQHRFEILGGYTLDQRVDEALSGLGFTRDEWTRPPTALSGGEQTRATLARLVIAQPDLLLLDEPTNHLDIGAIEWLEEHLRRRHGALLVASHDRAFLDATVTRIWELRDRRLTVFRGDYSAYHRQREERDARAAQGRRTHERRDRAREGARPALPVPPQVQQDARARGAAREAAGRARVEAPEGRAEACAAGRRPGRRRAVAVGRDRRPARGPRGRLPARARGAGRRRLRRRRAGPWRAAPFLAAQRGERIGIVGPNGAGKTTLLRTIAGDLPPLDGALTFGNAVQPGYLAQLRDAAIPGATVLDALLEAIPVTPGEARGYLARFLFRGDDVFKEVGTLSGGERSRLELALLGIMPSNLLLLDEPTNHLDIPAREAIEAFMRRVAGHAARRVPRPAAARDRLREAVGRRRRARGAVRRRLEGVAGGRGRRLDGRQRRAQARRAAAAGRRRGARRSRRAAAAAAADRARRDGDRPAPPGAAPAVRGRARGRSAAEALEGRLPAPEGRRRCRPDAARPAQEPARAVDGRSPASPRTSSRCAASRASSPTSSRRSPAAEDAWLDLEERAP